MFREPEALELYRNGMKTVPDMKALVHYVASVWDSETEENSQSTVEIIMLTLPSTWKTSCAGKNWPMLST